MRELYKFDTFLEMLDPIRGGYSCVVFEKSIVDSFPQGRKTRIILNIDGCIDLQCGIQPYGDGRYFSMIGRSKLDGHGYEMGQAISVVVYQDPNTLGISLPEVLSILLKQNDAMKRVWDKLTDGRKRTLCHKLLRINNNDKQVDMSLDFLEMEREKLAEKGKW